MLNKDECTPIPPRLNLQQYAFVHYHKGAFANTQQQGRGREIEGGERPQMLMYESAKYFARFPIPHPAIRKVPLLWLLCLLACTTTTGSLLKLVDHFHPRNQPELLKNARIVPPSSYLNQHSFICSTCFWCHKTITGPSLMT